MGTSELGTVRPGAFALTAWELLQLSPRDAARSCQSTCERTRNTSL
jgi:hypothetical protein